MHILIFIYIVCDQPIDNFVMPVHPFGSFSNSLRIEDVKCFKYWKVPRGKFVIL